MKNICCPKCNHTHTFKNDQTCGRSRHKCRKCGYQFTRTTKRGKPEEIVNTAVILYLFGLSNERHRPTFKSLYTSSSLLD